MGDVPTIGRWPVGHAWAQELRNAFGPPVRSALRRWRIEKLRKVPRWLDVMEEAAREDAARWTDRAAQGRVLPRTQACLRGQAQCLRRSLRLRSPAARTHRKIALLSVAAPPAVGLGG